MTLAHAREPFLIRSAARLHDRVPRSRPSAGGRPHRCSPEHPSVFAKVYLARYSKASCLSGIL